MEEGLINTIHATLQLHGVDISAYDESFLLMLFQNNIVEKNLSSENNYLELLKCSKKEAVHFRCMLQNTYTEFFRNALTFSILEKIILPFLIQKKKEKKQKEIRIWSAACSSGQEAYSMAILIEEFKIYNDKNFGYRIFATDKNDEKLCDARVGKYHADSLNNVSLKRIKNWFNRKDDTFYVKPLLKKNIEFSQFDLFDENLNSPTESVFGDFDIIICANIFFYYKPEYRKLILDKIKNSISINGFLVTGETERDILSNNNFIEVFSQSAIFRV